MCETDTPDLRRTAELTEDGVLAPEVDVRGDVPQAVADAIQTALDAEPNAANNPVLEAGDGRCVGRLHVRFNELPVMDESGGVSGWLAPYRAAEKVREALRPALPEGIEAEMGNNHRVDFYEVA